MLSRWSIKRRNAMVASSLCMNRSSRTGRLLRSSHDGSFLQRGVCKTEFSSRVGCPVRTLFSSEHTTAMPGPVQNRKAHRRSSSRDVASEPRVMEAATILKGVHQGGVGPGLAAGSRGCENPGSPRSAQVPSRHHERTAPGPWSSELSRRTAIWPDSLARGGVV